VSGDALALLTFKPDLKLADADAGR